MGVCNNVILWIFILLNKNCIIFEDIWLYKIFKMATDDPRLNKLIKEGDDG